MKKTKIDHYTDKEALDFHSYKKPGKIEISSSKNMTTKRDLALAYSPGVAAPVRAISNNPEAAFDYTSKGNLVAVISNGSAILGMGNLGALASKPVMEGKAVLFKKFANIDCFDIEVDEETMRARQPLPRCPHCDAVARPNILMFGDWNYIRNRNDEQRRRFDAWLAERRESRIVILEFGAGKAVPTVRIFSEEVCRQSPEATLIRFNPREPEVPRDRDVSIASGALESILAIASCRLKES